jgi:hypothetical protein
VVKCNSKGSEIMDIILYVSGVLVLIVSITLIFFISKGERVVNLVYKFNMCEKEIIEFTKIKARKPL